MTICFYSTISSSLFHYQQWWASEITLQRLVEKQQEDHVGITVMSDFSARAEQMGQINGL